MGFFPDSNLTLYFGLNNNNKILLRNQIMAHLQYFSGLKMSSYLNIGEKYDFLQEVVNINKIKHIVVNFDNSLCYVLY